MAGTHSKIAMVGAGLVGSTIAYTIAVRNLVSELVIIDINQEKAEGEALDIGHGLVALGEMNIHAGTYADIADSDIIIISAGMGRKPGETRLDLAKKNVGIIQSITKEIMKYYNGGVILCVSNPVDIVTYVVQKESGLPKEKVIGTGTSLDSARFRYLLSEKVGVDVKNVHGFMAGEHGDSQFAVWSSVNISGMSIDDYCAANNITFDKEELEKSVTLSGAEVIQKKGATYYAIASVAEYLCKAILNNQKAIHHVSCCLDGEYGLSNVCLSLPRVLDANGIHHTVAYNFTEDELAKFNHSAKQLQNMIESLGL